MVHHRGGVGAIVGTPDRLTCSGAKGQGCRFLRSSTDVRFGEVGWGIRNVVEVTGTDLSWSPWR